MAFLNEALAIFTTASDSVPLDRIKLLHVRAALYTRMGDWQLAMTDMKDAISLADRDTELDPTLRAVLLEDYAKLLRKNHQRREARAVEARINAIRTHSLGNSLVDVSELAASSKTGR